MGLEPTFSTPITIICLEDRLGYQTKRITMPSNDPEYHKRYIRQHYLDNKEYYYFHGTALHIGLVDDRKTKGRA